MADLFITFGEFLIIGSYLSTNILILRILGAIGMSAYVVAGFIAGYQNEGIKALIFFNTIAVLINLFKIFDLVKEQFSYFLPDELRDIHLKNFHNMSNSEFLKIYNIAKKVKFKPFEQIIKEDIQLVHLFFLISGKVDIRHKNNVITKLSPGHFLGEMNYISGINTTASVYVNSEEVECLEWDQDKLEEFSKKKPEIYNKFIESISIDLVHKLAAHNKRSIDGK